MRDARFEEGAEKPLRLIAQDASGLAIVSALLQDAVFPASEMRYVAAKRRFAILVNRFRWEDRLQATAAGRGFERVQSLLVIEDVLSVKSQGIQRSDAANQVLSLLSLAFEAGSEVGGKLVITLAGGCQIALELEALDVNLRDVTKPYLAPSGKVPSHDI